MKKIAVCATGENPESKVDGRFGRCNYFIINHFNSDQYTSLVNSGVNANQGAGIGTAQTLVKEGVNVVVTNRIGPKAFKVLKAAGIKMYAAEADQTVAMAVKEYHEGKLPEINSPNN